MKKGMLKEKLLEAKTLSAKYPELPNLFFADWAGIEKGYQVFQRFYTDIENTKIAAGLLYPVEKNGI